MSPDFTLHNRTIMIDSNATFLTVFAEIGDSPWEDDHAIIHTSVGDFTATMDTDWDDWQNTYMEFSASGELEGEGWTLSIDWTARDPMPGYLFSAETLESRGGAEMKPCKIRISSLIARAAEIDLSNPPEDIEVDGQILCCEPVAAGVSIYWCFETELCALSWWFIRKPTA